MFLYGGTAPESFVTPMRKSNFAAHARRGPARFKARIIDQNRGSIQPLTNIQIVPTA